MATPPRRPFGRNRPGACRTQSSTARRPSNSERRRCSALRPCWPSRPRSRQRGCGNRRPVRREGRLKLTCCRDWREHAPPNGLKGFQDNLDQKAGGVLPRLSARRSQPGAPDSPSFDDARAVAARLPRRGSGRGPPRRARWARRCRDLHPQPSGRVFADRARYRRPTFPRCCATADN